jgi:hypothetical protein
MHSIAPLILNVFVTLHMKIWNNTAKFFLKRLVFHFHIYMVVDQSEPNNSVMETTVSHSKILCHIQIGVGRHVGYMIRDFRFRFQRFDFFWVLYKN